MAAGMPIVASNIDGFAGVLTHGVEGLLTRPEDASALSDALLELLKDPERRAAWRPAAWNAPATSAGTGSASRCCRTTSA